MNFEFTENGWEEFQYWIETDMAIVEKIKELLNETRQTPFHGTGKPEPLKHELKGFWSRRINGEHRLVYKVEGEKRSQSKMLYHSMPLSLHLRHTEGSYHQQTAPPDITII
jgi:toxin YoeB